MSYSKRKSLLIAAGAILTIAASNWIVDISVSAYQSAKSEIASQIDNYLVAHWLEPKIKALTILENEKGSLLYEQGAVMSDSQLKERAIYYQNKYEILSANMRDLGYLIGSALLNESSDDTVMIEGPSPVTKPSVTPTISVSDRKRKP